MRKAKKQRQNKKALDRKQTVKVKKHLAARKKKESNQNKQEVNDSSQTEEVLKKCSSFESDVETSFFYTSDKFFAKLDSNDILDAILAQYPKLSVCEDSTIKKTLIQLIHDQEFVNYILSFYSISIYDFFRIIYSQFSSIFKGPYLKKVKSEFQKAKYKI